MPKDFAELISRFDELSTEELSHLDVLAAGNPERLELVAFARRVFETTAARRRPSVSPELLVEYVLRKHFVTAGSAADGADIDELNRIDAAIQADSVALAAVDELFARLRSFDDAVPAIDHFERLTGIEAAFVGQRASLPRKPARTVGETKPHSKGQKGATTRRISRRFRLAAGVAITAPVVAVILTMLVPRVGQLSAYTFPQFVESTLTDEGGNRYRGFIPAPDADVEHLREVLLAAVHSPAEPPFYVNRTQLEAVRDTLLVALLSARTQSAESEIRFLIATTEWGLGELEAAEVDFRILVQQGGTRSQAAGVALKSLE